MVTAAGSENGGWGMGDLPHGGSQTIENAGTQLLREFLDYRLLKNLKLCVHCGLEKQSF